MERILSCLYDQSFLTILVLRNEDTGEENRGGGAWRRGRRGGGTDLPQPLLTENYWIIAGENFITSLENHFSEISKNKSREQVKLTNIFKEPVRKGGGGSPSIYFF